MNKLQQIQAAVDAHFAAKEAYESFTDKLIGKLGENNYLKYTDIETVNSYNHNQDAAMCLLRDLLPLLNAAVDFEGRHDKQGDLKQVKAIAAIETIDTEAVKLLVEVE